jgi:hypothetical protein
MGPTVQLAQASAAKTTFTAPSSTSLLVFELRVSDGKAASQDQVLVNVVPKGMAPVVDFTYQASGNLVRFDALGGADASWDFGDGSKATGPTVLHEFQPGTHEVTMSVGGQQARKEVHVAGPVTEPAAAGAWWVWALAAGLFVAVGAWLVLRLRSKPL